MSDEVVIDYTNHRGERALRRVTPVRWFRGESPWHPGKRGWFMVARTTDRGDMEREFWMDDVHSWRTVE